MGDRKCKVKQVISTPIAGVVWKLSECCYLTGGFQVLTVKGWKNINACAGLQAPQVGLKTLVTLAPELIKFRGIILDYRLKKESPVVVGQLLIRHE